MGSPSSSRPRWRSPAGCRPATASRARTSSATTRACRARTTTSASRACARRRTATATRRRCAATGRSCRPRSSSSATAGRVEPLRPAHQRHRPAAAARARRRPARCAPRLAGRELALILVRRCSTPAAPPNWPASAAAPGATMTSGSATTACTALHHREVRVGRRAGTSGATDCRRYDAQRLAAAPTASFRRALAADGEYAALRPLAPAAPARRRTGSASGGGGGRLGLGRPHLSTLGFERERRVMPRVEHVRRVDLRLARRRPRLPDVHRHRVRGDSTRLPDRLRHQRASTRRASSSASRTESHLPGRARRRAARRHFVPEERRTGGAVRRETGDEVDKFTRVGWTTGTGRHAAARRLPNRSSAACSSRSTPRPRHDPARAVLAERGPTPRSSRSPCEADRAGHEP